MGFSDKLRMVESLATPDIHSAPKYSIADFAWFGNNEATCAVDVGGFFTTLRFRQGQHFTHTILLRSSGRYGLQLLADLGGHFGGLVLGGQGFDPLAGALDDVLGPAILPNVLGGPVNDR